MVDGPLHDRPLWVREGAALYFAEPDAGTAPRGRFDCPRDEELRRPISPGALGNAYARARACFARQIAAGKSWQSIR
jgi:hypothetical protein